MLGCWWSEGGFGDEMVSFVETVYDIVDGFYEWVIRFTRWWDVYRNAKWSFCYELSFIVPNKMLELPYV